MSYFILEAVSDGVWAAICQDPVFAMSNAAIVDLGDTTLVFDSSMSVNAALELKSLAEQVTHKPVSYLVNSHHHLDHCLGNQVFVGTTIISSQITRDLMQARFARLASEAGGFAMAIEQTKQQLLSASTVWEQNLFTLELAELEMLQAFLPQFKATLPSLTFTNVLEIHGLNRVAKILTFGSGHTALDAVLLVDDVLIAGDLVVHQHLGFIAHGNPESWLERLTDLEQIKNIQQIIPGHGAVGQTNLLTAMKTQLLEMIALGQTVPSVATAQPPTHWLEWGLPASYRANLEFLQQRKGV